MSEFPPDCLVNCNLRYLLSFFFLIIIYIVFDVVVDFEKRLFIFLLIKIYAVFLQITYYPRFRHYDN